MRKDQPMWEGRQDADVAVVFSTGDEGQVSDPVPRAVVAALVEAGHRVLCLPCVGGPLETRDARAARRILEVVPPAQTLLLAGASRGARISAGVLTQVGAAGLVAFAYPFHAKTDPRPLGRERALAQLTVPVLLVQGSRDSHGNRQQVRGYRLPPHIEVHWMEQANHALVPRPSSGLTQAGQLSLATQRMLAFIQAL